MKLAKVLFVLALAVVIAAPAYAETQNVKVSGSIDAYWFYRSNYDLRDNNGLGVVGTSTADFTGTSASAVSRSEGDDFFTSITQVEIAADLTDNVSTVINLVNQRDWNSNTFTTDNSAGSATASDEFDVLVDLAYVQMKEIFYSPLTLTIGRQDLSFGREFIIGWNPQDPNGTIQADEFTAIWSFDAIRATLDFNPWTLDLVYAKIDENANNPEDDSDLWIAYLNYQFSEYNAVADLYYVGYTDRAALSGSTGTRTNDAHTIGGRVQFDPISQMTIGGELAFQFGDYSVSLAATEQDVEAWAADVFATYRWDNQWNPEVTVEWVYLSGESDLSATATGDYESWHAPFRGPTYGLIHEYLETYYGTAESGDQAAGQNLWFISITGALNPMEDLRVWGTWYYFETPESSHATVTDPTTLELDDEIGHELDLGATYNYTEDVSFGLTLSWFFPGDLYRDPNDDTATQIVGSASVTF